MNKTGDDYSKYYFLFCTHSHGERTRGLVVPKRHSDTPSSHLRECYEASTEFTMVVIVLMAGLREKLELSNLPNITQAAALSMMLAGILSLTFMGLFL
jgi:hypothetical protein